jgi:hypothetical protein
MSYSVPQKPTYCVISTNGTLIGPIQLLEKNQYWISTAWGSFSTKTKFAAVDPTGNTKIVHQGGLKGCRRFMVKNNPSNLTQPAKK